MSIHEINNFIPKNNNFLDENSYLNINDHDHETDQYLQDMKNGASNILVVVRNRPLNSKELSISNFETIKIMDRKVVILLDPMNEFDHADPFRNNRNKEKQYAFDYAFDKDCSTAMIYEYTTKLLLEGILSGYNATVFAYGATGAGKTYSMLGNSEQEGIMGLTLNGLFDEISKQKMTKEFTIRVSYLEIYNELVKDLLSSEDNNLELREDPIKGVSVAGINEVEATSTSEVMQLLRIGNKNRTMEPTGANIVSSRSHAVLQVNVEHKERNQQGADEEIVIGKLSLIDLAGSERASNTNNKGMRMIEGANINRSLLALGNCITYLSEQHEKGIKNTHIPYRDSKLTRLLKDSLGGNCRTIMIANVSPSVISFEDTHNTLKYAYRAKSIKISSTKNTVQVSNHVAKYTQIISELKQENENLKKYLKQQQQQQQQQLSNPYQLENGNSSIGNDKIQNEIQNHFDQEHKLKRQIHETEEAINRLERENVMLMNGSNSNIGNNGGNNNNSNVGVGGSNNNGNSGGNSNITNETKNKEEQITRVKNSINRMKGSLQKMEEEYGNMVNKRQIIYNLIKGEKQKENQVFLISLFKQNQFLIENMDLQHKEKLAEDELKTKDREIAYLKNRLLQKGGGNSLDDYFEESKKYEISNVRMSYGNNNLQRDSPLKYNNNNNKSKEILRLPNINRNQLNGNDESEPIRSMKVLPKKIGSSIGHSNDDDYLVLKNKVKSEKKYYFKKLEWRRNVAKDFVPIQRKQKGNLSRNSSLSARSFRSTSSKNSDLNRSNNQFKVGPTVKLPKINNVMRRDYSKNNILKPKIAYGLKSPNTQSQNQLVYDEIQSPIGKANGKQNSVQVDENYIQSKLANLKKIKRKEQNKSSSTILT